jgi:hypothetical protein
MAHRRHNSKKMDRQGGNPVLKALHVSPFPGAAGRSLNGRALRFRQWREQDLCGATP